MKGLLKMVTCGSVDDGKSTLIGNLLYNSKLLYSDQKQILELESKVNNKKGKIDYSLLLDGLIAEREQGITIDVAYRYFTTENRSFIVADSPGHEEYTRNMAVGASFADLAVILIDVEKGILPQTHRHIRICSLMGITHFLFIINKMDRVEYCNVHFDEIKQQLKKIIKEFHYHSIGIIPVSATEGDNVCVHSKNMEWYDGYTFLQYIEQIDTFETNFAEKLFTMPVQRVSRSLDGKRGYQGIVEQGTLKIGDLIEILPSGEKAIINKLLHTDKEVSVVFPGQAITLYIDKEIDISRGCVILNAQNNEEKPVVTNTCQVNLLWMDNERLEEKQKLLFKCGTKIIPAQVDKICYKVDIQTGEQIDTCIGEKNDLLVCDLIFIDKVVISEIERVESLGKFILINRITNSTSACGIVKTISQNNNSMHTEKYDVTRDDRAFSLNQKPQTIWMTGLSGAGKTTIGKNLEKKMLKLGKHTMLLDGDVIRNGLNSDLGFSDKERSENIRRVAEVAKLLNDAGMIVIVSFISPFEKDRIQARQIIGKEFIEVYIETPLDVCEKRDPKGLYKMAREGKIKDFTGIDSVYEVPTSPDITINTTKDIERTVEELYQLIENHERKIQ